MPWWPIPSHSGLHLQVHAIWRAWLSRVSLKNGRGSSLTILLASQWVLDRIAMDPPSVLLRGGGRRQQGPRRAVWAPEPPRPAGSPFNLARWSTLGELSAWRERPRRRAVLTNCITVAWAIARFTTDSWLQNTGWWAPGAAGSRRGKNDSHLKRQRSGRARRERLAGRCAPGEGCARRKDRLKCWQVPGGIFSFFCLDLIAIVWEAGKGLGFVLKILARSLTRFFLSKLFELGLIG